MTFLKWDLIVLVVLMVLVAILQKLATRGEYEGGVMGGLILAEALVVGYWLIGTFLFIIGRCAWGLLK